jgi:hypothetical protein
MFIPDPNFFFPGSRIRNKEFKYFSLKIVFNLSVFHPKSRILILIFYPSRIPETGVKKALDPGSGSPTLASMHDTQSARRTVERAVMWMHIGFNTDLDPAFYFNADLDPDPGSQTNADPCRSGSWLD